jgi:hypothetical protein
VEIKWEHPSYAKACKSEMMKGSSHLRNLMNSEKAQLIQHHAEAIAALLYEDTSPEQVKTLESIEKTVREKVLEHVSPTIAVFLSAQAQGQAKGDGDISKAVSEH